MEAERNAKLAAAREAQRALDQEADKGAQPMVEKRKKAKRIPAALNIVPTPVLNSKGKKATKREIASRASVARGREKPALTVVPAAPAGVPAGEKFCKRHNTTHPLEDFASDRSSKDGRYSICRLAEKDDRAAKKARLAAAATPAPIAAAAMPQTVKAKKVSRKK
jgi:hypothetical protein